jgi:hypothetical protein
MVRSISSFFDVKNAVVLSGTAGILCAVGLARRIIRPGKREERRNFTTKTPRGKEKKRKS